MLTHKEWRVITEVCLILSDNTINYNLALWHVYRGAKTNTREEVCFSHKNSAMIHVLEPGLKWPQKNGCLHESRRGKNKVYPLHICLKRRAGWPAVDGLCIFLARSTVINLRICEVREAGLDHSSKCTQREVRALFQYDTSTVFLCRICVAKRIDLHSNLRVWRSDLLRFHNSFEIIFIHDYRQTSGDWWTG